MEDNKAFGGDLENNSIEVANPGFCLPRVRSSWTFVSTSTDPSFRDHHPAMPFSYLPRQHRAKE